MTPAQREQRGQELLAALAEQERSLEEVESAAPYLISSDGVDIEGLEPELVDSGRYIGQHELALLVADWVKTYRRPSLDRWIGLVRRRQRRARHARPVAS